jgi:hypothetical protein
MKDPINDTTDNVNTEPIKLESFKLKKASATSQENAPTVTENSTHVSPSDSPTIPRQNPLL